MTDATDTTHPTPLLVRDLSETELLGRIFPLLPSGDSTLLGPGDDAAVVAAPDGRFVVTTDVLVEDRHFRRRWSSGEDVGVRAAVQNLADVAAMGARPTALVVSLVVPGDLPVAWVAGLARGLASACAPSGAAVVGGDLSGGDCVVVAVTAHGDLEGRAPVTRSGAQDGDVLAHAGVRGRSAAGLALLDAHVVEPRGRAADAVPETLAPFVSGYLRPAAPLGSGPAAATHGATAMLDVSDGLLRDAGRLARASGVVVDVESATLDAEVRALLPATRALAAHALGAHGQGGDQADEDRGDLDRALDWVLAGGEDHGLLATFPAGAKLPVGFRQIGTVRAAVADDVDGPGVTLDGVTPSGPEGWDHFRA